MSEVSIESLDHKGRGVTASGVRVYKVLPGERVQVTRPRRKRAALEEVVEASPDRVEPVCEHAGVCGGCSLQHMDYKAQLAWKEERVRGLFGLKPRPILPCEPPWRYRNKMEFTFGSSRDGKRFLGLLIPWARGRVVDVKGCHLVAPWYGEALERVRGWWASEELEAYKHHKDWGHLRTLTLRDGPMAILTVSGNPEFGVGEEQLERFADLFEEGTSVVVRVQRIEKGKPTRFLEHVVRGPAQVEEELGGLKFKVSPGAFFQPNRRMAVKLYREAIAMAGLEGSETVYDLYCGTGTLALFAAEKVKEVVGVELNGDAVADAEENARLNGIENVRFVQGDVGQLELGRPDLVFVDPPRAGLGKGVEVVRAMGARRVVYVSCNPATQAEDVERLGGKVVALQPVDQFPHTAHVENICLIEF